MPTPRDVIAAPAEQAERRHQRALKAARTRRERRAQRETEARSQPKTARPGPDKPARHTRPWMQPDALTVAIRGPMAARMRELAERYDMSPRRVADLTAQPKPSREPSSDGSSPTPRSRHFG
jgi:hypothetical protein